MIASSSIIHQQLSSITHQQSSSIIHQQSTIPRQYQYHHPASNYSGPSKGGFDDGDGFRSYILP
jgi:hypothetical protein